MDAVSHEPAVNSDIAPRDERGLIGAQERNEGSDVLWALGDQRYAVVEAKSGARGSLIWKKEINQLTGSVEWCKAEYSDDATVVPVMMHRSSVVEQTGTPATGTRILTADRLDALKVAVRAFATALADRDGFRAPEIVGAQLEHHKLTGSVLVPTYTVAATRES